MLATPSSAPDRQPSPRTKETHSWPSSPFRSTPPASPRVSAGRTTWPRWATQARTEDNYGKTKLTDEERKFFSGSALGKVKYAVILAENWCGDVHRNSPLLAHVCEAMPNCELRVFFRDQNLDITDLYLNNGYRSIPVIVFFDANWNEIGHWIERSGAATQKMIGLRAKTVDVAPADQQDAALAEFRKQYQALHDGPNSLWREAAKEVQQVLAIRLGLLPAEAKK